MRQSGILMPVSALPGAYGIGSFSKEAYKFVDWLQKSGQSLWQILPLGPTSYGDSPYQSFSTFAGNPYFIDLETLAREGLLEDDICRQADFGNNSNQIDYGMLYQNRFHILKVAYEHAKEQQIMNSSDYVDFLNEQNEWLSDYALYMSVKDYFHGAGWNLWEENIRLRRPDAISHYQDLLTDEIHFYQFLQYEFYKQWNMLKEYANQKGIQIIGDIPIYVAYDSADVWAHPELFQLDESGQPTAVAGCPPDGFSATGQLWGNPVYKWDYHKQTGYTWWIKRIENSTKLYDVIRIDHFRGFDEYYAIPAGSKNAVIGKWEKGPGMDLFDVVKEKLGEISIIAEDLGYITDSVRQLVKDSNFPNMKVLEFAFDARDSYEPCEYLPFTYYNNCVVYTGTHDNETLLGWLKHVNDYTLGYIKDYIGRDIPVGQEMVDEIIRLAHSSVADLCIIPLQDYLGLGNEARINTPSTLGDNWKWRVTKDKLTDKVADKIRKYTNVYRR